MTCGPTVCCAENRQKNNKITVITYSANFSKTLNFQHNLAFMITFELVRDK